MIVRGVYYEGWQPSRTPQKLRSKEEFFTGVSAKLAPHPIAGPVQMKPEQVENTTGIGLASLLPRCRPRNRSQPRSCSDLSVWYPNGCQEP